MSFISDAASCQSSGTSKQSRDAPRPRSCRCLEPLPWRRRLRLLLGIPSSSRKESNCKSFISQRHTLYIKCPIKYIKQIRERAHIATKNDVRRRHHNEMAPFIMEMGVSEIKDCAKHTWESVGCWVRGPAGRDGVRRGASNRSFGREAERAEAASQPPGWVCGWRGVVWPQCSMFSAALAAVAAWSTRSRARGAKTCALE